MEPYGDISMNWPLLAAALMGYLLGSIPFGLILTRLAGLGDIRQIGSGNIGATNVLRTGSKKLAAATLFLDGAKAVLAVLIAAPYGPELAIVAGGGALLGHCFPVWLKFNGGKGVATALGILLAIAWPVGLITCALWLAIAFVLRYSSVAALAALAIAPVLCLWLADSQRAWLAVFILLVVTLRHKENIGRLLRGEESKIRLSSKGTTAGTPEA